MIAHRAWRPCGSRSPTTSCSSSPGLQIDPQEPGGGRGASTAPAPGGASGRCSLPLLTPTTFFLLVINIVYAFFDTFAIIDAATSGGPGKDTAILVYKVYYDGLQGDWTSADRPRRAWC
jgi:hypothetical protein